MENKRYKLFVTQVTPRKIMKLGRCFPADIKPHKESKETDTPSVFVFENICGKEFKVIRNPAEARHLLQEGKKAC